MRVLDFLRDDWYLCLKDKIQFCTAYIFFIGVEGCYMALSVLLILSLNHFHPLPTLILPLPSRAVKCEVERNNSIVTH